MLRSELFQSIGGNAPAPDTEITGVTSDSRAVRPGFVFVALSGHARDGHAFIADAIERGASAIVTERLVNAPVPQRRVACGRRALAFLAANLNGHPARRVRTIGVTGTKGKTTTTYFLRSIVRATGRECGLLGTIAREAFGASVEADGTTPDPAAIQEFLRELDCPNGGYAAMEVSSHALCQHRVAALPFEVAVFTNLSGEHLDYHHTMDRYHEAKALLFLNLMRSATACLNVREPKWLPRFERTRSRIIYYGFPHEGAPLPAVRAENAHLGADQSLFDLRLPGEAERVPIRLKLVGRHNVENALGAAAAAHALGIGADAIRRGLEGLTLVPGRLERVEAGQPFPIFVDYAHTDDALEKVLTALRPLAGAGRLICVFGCGGDRDRTKRPRMAQVAERLADRVIITSDNPRTEDPLRIISDIQVGLRSPAAAAVEPDRHSAISAAIFDARPGDIVLIAGKGHETYQIIGKEKHPFDDREVAREVVTRLFAATPERHQKAGASSQHHRARSRCPRSR